MTNRLVLAFVVLAGCGGGDNNGSSDHDMSATCSGAPTPGPADVHCAGDGGGVFNGAVDPSMCTASSGESAPDYGDTMYGTMGRDDDCKYVVSYTVDPICENEGVTYVVTATYAKDGMPVTGAATRIEAYLNDEHPAPNSGTTTSEKTPGVYTITPVKFDASGKWTVRFHFFENCEDVDGSPHGHAAFYMTVP